MLKKLRVLSSLTTVIALGTLTLSAQETENVAATSIGNAPMQTPVPQKHSKTTFTTINIDKPVAALTFDDGPHASLTPKLLDILKARKVKATFFVVGTNAAEYPAILKRIVAEGHEIGNHSWNHPNFAKMSNDAIKSQMDRTNEAIKAATGITPTVMRPPYGSLRETQREWMKAEYGMPTILWGVDPLDWRDRKAAVVRDRIVNQTKPGDIILAHDIHASTVDAMASAIDQLLGRGYEFVTVSELIKLDKPSLKKETPASEPAPYTPKVKGKGKVKSKAASTTTASVEASVVSSVSVPK